MPGLISRETLRYQYLLVRSEGRWVSLHLCTFFLLNICNFYVFFVIYIIFFCYTRVFEDMCSLCVDVGPVRPTDYARNMCRPQPGAAPAAAGGPAVAGDLPAGEAERVLR
jgi:hypothetical protein